MIPISGDCDHHDEHEHDEHKHDEHEETHSDIVVSWTYNCNNIEQVKQIDVGLFEQFSWLEKVDAQALLNQQQYSWQLTNQQTIIKW